MLPIHSRLYSHAFLAVFDLGWQFLQIKTLVRSLQRRVTPLPIERMAQYGLFIHPATPEQLVCSTAYHSPALPRHSCTLQDFIFQVSCRYQLVRVQIPRVCLSTALLQTSARSQQLLPLPPLPSSLFCYPCIPVTIQVIPIFSSPAQPGLPQPSPAQPSPAYPSPAQPGLPQPSPAQPSPAQPGPAQPSPAQPKPTIIGSLLHAGGAVGRVVGYCTVLQRRERVLSWCE